MSADCRSCPRFDVCGAPICPLDPNWRKTRHLSGERICLYLTELGKPGGAEVVRSLVPTAVAEKVISDAAAILAQFSPIRNVCKYSAMTGSRMRNWQARTATPTGSEALQKCSTPMERAEVEQS